MSGPVHIPKDPYGFREEALEADRASREAKFEYLGPRTSAADELQKALDKIAEENTLLRGIVNIQEAQIESLKVLVNIKEKVIDTLEGATTCKK